MAQQLPLNVSNVYNHNFKTTIFTHIKSSVYLQSVANTTIKIPVHRDRAKHMNPSCRRWLIQYTVDVIIRYISIQHSIARIRFIKICTLPSNSKYYISIFIDQSDLLPISA